MPLYTYKCILCKQTTDAVRCVEERGITPPCKCGSETKKIIVPTMVAPQFQSYKAVAGDGRMIHSRNEHKNFLSENNLEEVGNEKISLPESEPS